MSLTREQRHTLIETYAQGPARLRDALARVPATALQWRPAAGRWSVHEIVCHCADSEANAHMRIRYLVGESSPVIAGYDQDCWAATFDYHRHPIEPALAVIDAVRANTVALIRRAAGFCPGRPPAATRRSRGPMAPRPGSRSTPSIWTCTPVRSRGIWRRGRRRNLADDPSRASRVSESRGHPYQKAGRRDLRLAIRLSSPVTPSCSAARATVSPRARGRPRRAGCWRGLRWSHCQRWDWFRLFHEPGPGPRGAPPRTM